MAIQEISNEQIREMIFQTHDRIQLFKDEIRAEIKLQKLNKLKLFDIEQRIEDYQENIETNKANLGMDSAF